MTFFEKWKQCHPGCDWAIYEDHPVGSCPADFGYEERHGCVGMRCRDCWAREVPEEQCNCYIVEHGMSMCNGTKERETCTCGGDKRKCSFYPNKPTTVDEPHIKDSGDRTEFETGAVRDMREGKGRCDLMPLDVIGIIYATFCDEEESSNIPRVFFELNDFKKTGDPNYLIRALNQSGVFGESCSTMFLEVAKHFEDGAKKYGENNWQKGIPVNCYIDSAIRHYLKWLREDTDEPHDRAFVWNIMCAIWTCRNVPEMNSYAKEE